ncbi:serine/threonine-protein kinase Pink1, mitochondrial-like isoform X2 [Ruditapes philippinarum]|uniref:serine/threonine-protein kinase Pink1, mitochondrial-like isoform X2 n=1 Tax=Ruditapes philippinarum TaxID=129788 RepID=UPI00295BC877|nr:serine/threonine-protein kinase Pink1, mitochondrial-like isoform X2 [Ruditapes philippinarum]
MTSKALISNVLRKGKQVFQGIVKTQTQKAGVKVTRIPKQTQTVQQVVTYQSQATRNKLFNVWQKILPKYYFNSIASRIGRQAAWRCGRNVPLFSFVGLVMAHHAEKEEEEILGKIQDFVKATDTVRSPLLEKIGQLSLEQFEFGQLIGQGCNAAVYEAHLKTDSEDKDIIEAEDNESNNTSYSSPADIEESPIVREDISDAEDDTSDSGSDITILSLSDDDLDESEKAPLEFLTTAEDDFIDFPDSDSEISILSSPEDVSDVEYACMAPGDFNVTESLISYQEDEEEDDNNIGIKQNSVNDLSLSMSCAEIVAKFMGKMDEASDQGEIFDGNVQEYNSLDSSFSSGICGKFNLAVKMMFNYGAESNADAIMREMERETIPARLAMSHGQMETWQNGHKVRKKRLPPHPNIVEMWGVFVDPVPHLPDSLLNYPAALPARINPHGIGRNMTLFLVMKKYQNTLGEYLSTFNPSLHERLILLAQLLEAVCHMRRHGIAHRDLKMDNIFLDTSTAGTPQLVVGDFGCCLADDRHGLQIPYPTEHMDRGGNTALMAPEISTAEPGMFSYLDYSKSDLWATGALAYEILGADNPFYTHANKGRLDSRTYSKEELPLLPDDVPEVVKQLVSLMLDRKASQRPTARFAADVLHVFLWSPSDWLSPSNTLSRSQVNWWLISMATEVLLGAKSAERDLKRSFLENINMNRLSDVFYFLGAKIE